MDHEQKPKADSAPHESSRPPGNPTGSHWPALGWREWLPIGLASVAVAALTIRCLPPSICLGDFGDLQLAAATLGIAHPPGYVIIASLLYPLTLLPIDPMYAVSIGCLLSGLVTLIIGMLLLIRLGASPWIAAAAMAWLVQYSRVRLNLIAPEVYMPTLLFLASSTYLALRYANRPRRRDLFLAGLCFSVAVFSRPPMVLAAPFFLVAWWLVERRRPLVDGGPKPKLGRSLTLLVFAAALPGIYALAYSLVRDDPDTRYNYVEHYNFDAQELPSVEQGFSARTQRSFWLISGQQFTEYLRFNANRVRRMTNWLRNEISPAGYGWIPFISMVLLCAAGFAIACRRTRPAAILLGALMIQSFLYLCMYEMHGQAADILPLMFAGAIFIGLAIWQVLALLGRFARYAAVFLFSMTLLIDVAEVLPSKLCNPSWVDARWFVDQLQLQSFPPDAVILAMWDESVPIRYAQLFGADRPDITIVTSTFHRWPPLAERYADRPVFVTRPLDWLPEQYRSEPHGPIWRVHRVNP